MSDGFALTPFVDPELEASRAQVAELEATVSARETELETCSRDLLALQTRYLDEVGALYARLSDVEDQVAEIEIRLGLRQPPAVEDEDAGDQANDHDEQRSDEGDDRGDGNADGLLSACASRPDASGDLKRIFRDIAKAIHPDRAIDGAARYRRHSLMAEANRAYAERDEDRLRLILRAWERSPDAIPDTDPDADRRRLQRRTAELDERLMAIEGDFADLRRSAIWRLKGKIDTARTQGWDLFAEMVMQVKREIARAQSRLASLRAR